jgi:hypothetical protein
MADTGLQTGPFQLEISNLAAASQIGQPTLITYRLTNHGPQTMPSGGAFVRAVAAARNGSLVDQSHWYERPLPAGGSEDLQIHLDIIDPGEYGISLQIADPQSNLIAETDPILHEVKDATGVPAATATSSDAPYFLHLHILDVKDIGKQLTVDVKLVNSGSADAPVGTTVILTAKRASDGVEMATEEHPIIHAVPAGSHSDGSMTLQLDPGDYELELVGLDPSKAEPDTAKGTVA